MIEELKKRSKNKCKRLFHKNDIGLYIWIKIAGNGRELGRSIIGYKNRLDCVKNAQNLNYKGG